MVKSNLFKDEKARASFDKAMDRIEQKQLKLLEKQRVKAARREAANLVVKPVKRVSSRVRVRAGNKKVISLQSSQSRKSNVKKFLRRSLGL